MTARVVITGMGVVSPNGQGKQPFCRAILDGKSGVKRIARFDPSELPVHIAGEIPDFDESPGLILESESTFRASYRYAWRPRARLWKMQGWHTEICRSRKSARSALFSVLEGARRSTRKKITAFGIRDR